MVPLVLVPSFPWGCIFCRRSIKDEIIHGIKRQRREEPGYYDRRETATFGIVDDNTNISVIER